MCAALSFCAVSQHQGKGQQGREKCDHVDVDSARRTWPGRLQYTEQRIQRSKDVARPVQLIALMTARTGGGGLF